MKRRMARAAAAALVMLAALAKLKADAAAQLARYAKDNGLARAWRLREAGGTVALHRIAVVFHGGDVALCEEI